MKWMKVWETDPEKVFPKDTAFKLDLKDQEEPAM